MSEESYARMPWGRYRGYFLKDIPTAYLKWAVLNYTDIGMAIWLKDELLRRPQVRRQLKKPIVRSV